MRLNLGCGPDYRDGWLNVDIDAHVKADLRAAVSDHGRMDRAIAGQPVEAIYMKHVLEHLPIVDVVPHLAWCHRTLVPGGTLTIDGPDLRAMCRHLANKTAWTWEDVQMIYGGQTTPFDHHHAGWGPDFLGGLLHAAGFTAIRYQQVGLCFVMEGTK